MTEPLREFLDASLSQQPVELDEHEIITDAVVLFRVVNPGVSTEWGVAERYGYTTTEAVTLASALGMIDITRTIMMHFYENIVDQEDEDEDDG